MKRHERRATTILAVLRPRLEALYGPRLARLMLYGLQVRGDAEPGSDIDVLVVLEGPVDSAAEIHRSSEIVAGLSLEYDEVLSYAFVERKRAAVERSPLLLNVRKEGIAI